MATTADRVYIEPFAPAPTGMSLTLLVNAALVARWIHTWVAAGVVALFVHVSDTDAGEVAIVAVRFVGPAGACRNRTGVSGRRPTIGCRPGGVSHDAAWPGSIVPGGVFGVSAPDLTRCLPCVRRRARCAV